MLQFKYMTFINFARTLCRVGVVQKKEEGYISYTCLPIFDTQEESLHQLGVGVKFTQMTIGFN